MRRLSKVDAEPGAGDHYHLRPWPAEEVEALDGGLVLLDEDLQAVRALVQGAVDQPFEIVHIVHGCAS